MQRVSKYFSLFYIVKALITRAKILPYLFRLRMEALESVHYAYCVYHSAVLAKKLGHKRISVIEFGVAGGNGLVQLEKHSQIVSKLLSIEIEVYGFDLAKGLPEPSDYRDLPYKWRKGFFEMDVDKLKIRLKNAKLVLGNIKDTIGDFVQKYNPAPVAAVMFDVDYYTSTMEALRIFDIDPQYRLPRIFCYFDDIVGNEAELFNDYTGMRLAMNEFNEENSHKKLSESYHLITRRLREQWYHQIYILHDFEHPKYNEFIAEDNQQLKLG